MASTAMLPCYACCPARPDLGYHKAGKARHSWDFVEVAGEFVWGWRCMNCSNVKKPRNRAPLPTYDEITQTLTTADKLSRPNAVLFHCFNPNGLYAQLKAAQARIGDWVVDNPDKPNGVLLVHGSMNEHPRKTLFALLDKRRRVGRIPYLIGLNTVRGAIADADEWLTKKAED